MDEINWGCFKTSHREEAKLGASFSYHSTKQQSINSKKG